VVLFSSRDWFEQRRVDFESTKFSNTIPQEFVTAEWEKEFRERM
jgi:hypothetical protein